MVNAVVERGDWLVVDLYFWYPVSPNAEVRMARAVWALCGASSGIGLLSSCLASEKKKSLEAGRGGVGRS